MNTKLLSVKDIEDALNLGHTKVCELIADGDIESIKVGRRRLITPDALDHFIGRMGAGEPTVGDLKRMSSSGNLLDSCTEKDPKADPVSDSELKGVIS